MQQFRDTVLVSFELLLDNNLSLDCWFILYCLSHNKKDLLVEYTEKCSRIKTIHFETLVNKGYIILRDKENITLNTIRLTELGKSIIVENSKEDDKFNEYFQQLRDTYPKKVPGEYGTFRPLHGDLNRCKKLYKRLLSSIEGIDQQMHQKVLKAICVQVNEYTKAKKLPYMQNLATYLHQQNYLQYFDVDKEELQVERGDDI